MPPKLKQLCAIICHQGSIKEAHCKTIIFEKYENGAGI